MISIKDEGENKMTDKEGLKEVKSAVDTYFSGCKPKITTTSINNFKRDRHYPGKGEEYIKNENVLVDDEYIIKDYTKIMFEEVKKHLLSVDRLGYSSLEEYIAKEDYSFYFSLMDYLHNGVVDWYEYIIDYLKHSFGQDDFYMDIDEFLSKYSRKYY